MTRQNFKVINPTTTQVLAGLPIGSADDVADAVDKAAAADWPRMTPPDRADAVLEGVQRAGAAGDELARLQCLEMGQPWSIARPLVDALLAEFADTMTAAINYPFVTSLATTPATTEVRRLPRGPAALITPWNFPLPVALGGLMLLIAAGNAVVWKPSEISPLSALRLVELLDLPAGALTVVTGDASTGRALCDHPDIAIGHFTGSVAAGREVARRFADRFRPVVMELGGKDPVVIDADVDPLWAAQVVAHGAFWNSGQVCTSMERIYVHDSIAAQFVDALAATTERYVVGDPLDPATELGPLGTAEHREHVRAHLADAEANGAQVVARGTTPELPGWFLPPVVVTGLEPGMRLHDEETFGPVAAVRTVSSYDEGIALARASAYGLAATVLTNNGAHAAQAAELPAAVVWVNEWQGGASGAVYEPTGVSGIGVVGTLDTMTRPMMLHRAPAGPAA
ncbi:MAG: aldehyde dehydrogenase family protein [Actinomycetota bacterium]|nr:aldehyde dehydrogenase family protein [Actinomycetota bacterium]